MVNTAWLATQGLGPGASPGGKSRGKYHLFSVWYNSNMKILENKIKVIVIGLLALFVFWSLFWERG
jgi:hypothetical protein